MKCHNKHICCKKSGEHNTGGSLLFSGSNLRFNPTAERSSLDPLAVSASKIINGKDHHAV